MKHKKDYKVGLLFGLILATAAVGLIWFKYYSPYGADVKSRASSAHEEQANWPHSTMPFDLKLNNYTTAGWSKTMEKITAKWSKAGAINYVVTTPPAREGCPTFLNSLGMNVCSINDPSYGLVGAWYFQGPNSPKILGAVVKLNDAQLLNPGSPYSTDAWRNNSLCQFLGWTAGVLFRFGPPVDASSCMNYSDNSKTVINQQFPDANDLVDMYTLYNESIDNVVSENEAKYLEAADQAMAEGSYGQMTKSSANGKLKQYKLDLGQGYSMTTMILSK